MRWWPAVVMTLLHACAAAPAPERVAAMTRALATGDAAANDAAVVDDAGAPSGGTAARDGEAAVRAPSCCAPSDLPGCDDAPVATCLCEIDPFCCSERHDALCVREAVSSCGLQCAPPPADHDCCSPSDSPGCQDAPVLACVCEIDPACCQLRFDQSCINLASARCGAACSSEGAP